MVLKLCHYNKQGMLPGASLKLSATCSLFGDCIVIRNLKIGEGIQKTLDAPLISEDSSLGNPSEVYLEKSTDLCISNSMIVLSKVGSRMS